MLVSRLLRTRAQSIADTLTSLGLRTQLACRGSSCELEVLTQDDRKHVLTTYYGSVYQEEPKAKTSPDYLHRTIAFTRTGHKSVGLIPQIPVASAQFHLFAKDPAALEELAYALRKDALKLTSYQLLKDIKGVRNPELKDAGAAGEVTIAGRTVPVSLELYPLSQQPRPSFGMDLKFAAITAQLQIACLSDLGAQANDGMEALRHQSQMDREEQRILSDLEAFLQGKVPGLHTEMPQGDDRLSGNLLAFEIEPWKAPRGFIRPDNQKFTIVLPAMTINPAHSTVLAGLSTLAKILEPETPATIAVKLAAEREAKLRTPPPSQEMETDIELA